MAFRVLVLLAFVGCIQCKLLNLSCQQIKEFVNQHNTRREQVLHGKVPGQPAATEMKYMVWDTELAAKAAKWASSNQNGHNPDRTVGSGRFGTGENLYWYSTTDHSAKLSVSQAMDAWFNEYRDYRYGPLSGSDFASSKQIGHYTQLVWSDSTHLGCAIGQFTEGQWNKFFVVCNYGPTGNYIGQTPYKSGNPGGRLLCSIGNCDKPYGDRC